MWIPRLKSIEGFIKLNINIEPKLRIFLNEKKIETKKKAIFENKKLDNIL